MILTWLFGTNSEINSLTTDLFVGGARAYCVAKKLAIAPSCGYQEIITILLCQLFLNEKKKISLCDFGNATN